MVYLLNTNIRKTVMVESEFLPSLLDVQYFFDGTNGGASRASVGTFPEVLDNILFLEEDDPLLFDSRCSKRYDEVHEY